MKSTWNNILIVCALLLTMPVESMSKVGFGKLTIEGRTAPQGLDEPSPRFGWQIQSDQKDVRQKAYHVLVASSQDKLDNGIGDVWDSQKVRSDQSQHVAYIGKPLEPNTTYYWKVRTWTNKGNSKWSVSASWSTGIMGDEHWQGQWIGTDSLQSNDYDGKLSRCTGRYFRKEFGARNKVRRAYVHVSGLGYYALYINGQRVGRDWLTPAPTDFTKSVAYNSYDVTSLIGRQNAIGAVVAAGYYFAPRQQFEANVRTTYGLPRLRLDLILEYEDGWRETIATDRSWKMCTEGPLRYSNLYDGELFDSRLSMPDWTSAGFDDSTWVPATSCSAPGGTMRGSMTEPITVYETNRPLSINRIGNRYLIDFGTNSAGVVKLRIRAAKGDTVRIRHAELLKENGTQLYTDNLRSAQGTALYVSDGTINTWSPEFTWFGFRYAEVTGVDSLGADDVERLLLSDNLSSEGNSIHFLNNNTLNLIVDAAYRGIRSNYKGIPMDCPQRDERMPWTGDRTTGCLGESYTLDVWPLYAKWLQDFADAQRADGALSDVMPAYWRLYNSNITWPAVLPFACEMLNRQYGDSRVVARFYGNTDRWLRFVRNKSYKAGLITYDRYGDWCVPPEGLKIIHTKDSSRITDGQLISSCYYYYLCKQMTRYAQMMQLADDQEYYEHEAKTTRDAINATFLHENTYSNSTVTANLMALAMDAVPEEKIEGVKETLIKTIVETNDYKQSCGVIGIQWLMRYLASIGRGDISWRIATATKYPSWGYMIGQDATTIWELWNGNTANPSMNSGNHVMLLGDLLPWCYEYMGGIRSSEEQPGFKHIILAPDFNVKACAGVEASHASTYGNVQSSWKREGGYIVWGVTIPANTTAELHFPNGERKTFGSGDYHLTVQP